MSRTNYSPAQGEPWQIMYVNVVNLLTRSCGIHPLRLTCREVVSPCIPDLGDGDEKTQNLLRCVNYEPYVNFFLTEVEEVFHMLAEERDVWPCPRAGGTLVIQQDHPHFRELKEWVVGASEHEDFISDARIYLNRALKTLKHPTWVEKFWPEIAPYVGKIPKAMTHGMREPLPRQVVQDFPLQDKIQNMLTAASLLPRDLVVKAWIGSYQPRLR